MYEDDDEWIYTSAKPRPTAKDDDEWIYTSANPKPSGGYNPMKDPSVPAYAKGGTKRQAWAQLVQEQGSDMGNGFKETEAPIDGTQRRIREDGAVWNNSMWVDPDTGEDAGASPTNLAIKAKAKTSSAIGSPQVGATRDRPILKDAAIGVGKALPAAFTDTFRKTGTILKKYPWMLAASALPLDSGEAIEEYYKGGEEIFAPEGDVQKFAQGVAGIPATMAKYSIPGALPADLAIGGAEQVVRAQEKGSSLPRALAVAAPNAALQYAMAKFGGDSGGKIAKLLEIPGVGAKDIARALRAETGKNVTAATVQTVANNLSERYGGADRTRKPMEGFGESIATQLGFLGLGVVQKRGEFTKSLEATRNRAEAIEGMPGPKEPTNLVEFLESREANLPGLAPIPFVKPKPVQPANLDIDAHSVNPLRDQTILPTRREDLSPQFEEARRPTRAGYNLSEQTEAEHALVRNTLKGLPASEVEAIAHLMSEGQQRGVAFTPEQAAQLGVSGKGYKAYRAFVDDYASQLKERRAAALEQYEATGDPKFLEIVNQADQAKANNPEYAPRNREGKFAVAYSDGEHQLGLVSGDSRVDVLEKAARLEAMRPDLVGKRGEVSAWNTKKPSGAVGGGLDKHFIQAKNIPGADLDFVRSHFEYTRKTGKKLAQIKYGDQIEANINELARLASPAGRGTEAFKKASEQAHRALQKEWEFLQGAGVHPLAKRLGKTTVISLMGMDLAQFGIQPFQLVTHADPTFTADFGRGEGSVALRRGIKIGAKLQTRKFIDAITGRESKPWESIGDSDVRGYAPRGMDEAAFIKETQEAARLYHERGGDMDIDKAMNMSRMPDPARTDLGKLAQQTGDALMWPLRVGEYVNRNSTFLGSYLQYRKQGVDHAKAQDMAARMSDRINNVSGEINMSHLKRAAQGFGTIPTRLKGFGPQYVNLVERNTRKAFSRLKAEGKPAPLALAGALVPAVESAVFLGLVAGYKAVPFITDAWETLRQTYNIGTGGETMPGLDQVIEAELAKRKVPEQVRMATRMGIFSVLGIDVSGRLGMDRIVGIQSDAGRVGGARGVGQQALNVLTGATMSQFDRTTKIGEGISERDLSKVAAGVLPRGLGNLATAAEGEVSVGGAKRPMTMSERFSKGIGVQPASIANAQFKERIAREAKIGVQAFRKAMVNEALDNLRDGKGLQSVELKIAAYNAKQKKAGNTLGLLKPSSVTNALKAIKAKGKGVQKRAAQVDAMLKAMEESDDATDETLQPE